MSTLAAGTPISERVRATLGVFISLAGLASAITLLFLGMRAVMEIGGVCAEGGPFVTRQPCPEGIPGVMLGSIWGGIAFCAVYVWQTIKHDVPSLILLAWPALFLSLGWNFLEFALNPPDESGLVWGWLICGILFMAMGGLPLIAMLPVTMKGFTEEEETRPGFKSVVTEPIRSLRNLQVRTQRDTTERPDPFTRTSSSESSDLVGELERLAELHRSGALGDSEYAAAKRRLLEDR